MQEKELVYGMQQSNELLSDEEKRSLDERGFVVLEGIIEPEALGGIREDFELIMKKEGFLQGRDIKDEGPVSMGDLIAKQFTKDHELHHQLPNDNRVDNLVNKGEAFDQIYIEPKCLSAITHIFKKEFKLSSLSALEALPDKGEQVLRGEDDAVCIWLLDDYNNNSGTIRVVSSDSKEEVNISAVAGSVIVIKPNVRFGENLNKGSKNRRAVYCSYTTRDHQAQVNQLEFLRRSTHLRISPLAKYILNV